MVISSKQTSHQSREWQEMLQALPGGTLFGEDALGAMCIHYKILHLWQAGNISEGAERNHGGGGSKICGEVLIVDKRENIQRYLEGVQ